MRLVQLGANIKRSLGARVVNAIPFEWMRTTIRGEPIVLYYHLVSDQPVAHVRHLYRHKNVRQFVDDLEFLLRHYVPLSLAQFMRWNRGEGSIPKNAFLLTFDDGLREVHDYIAPALAAKGIPATFFVCEAFVDNKELCYQHKASLLVERLRQANSDALSERVCAELAAEGIREGNAEQRVLAVDYRRKHVLDTLARIVEVDFTAYLREQAPYLSTGQIRSLLASGFTFGGHSIDHPYYRAIPLREQLRQTLQSVRYVKNAFELSYGAFAFPHTDRGVGPEFFRAYRS
jgi:peptidoglycan/xylan/chitin deacetylase (PgdA/CDA1 family)